MLPEPFESASQFALFISLVLAIASVVEVATSAEACRALAMAGPENTCRVQKALTRSARRFVVDQHRKRGLLLAG